ncbi:MAG TPA: formimidoylglutamase [Bacteroidia bacterium]|nr:formimidoylglutamase [Bacteroidia bacterium]
MSGSLDFSEFFQPVDTERIASGKKYSAMQFGERMQCYSVEKGWPDLVATSLVFIGVNEDRRTVGNHGTAMAADQVRTHLYRLFQGEWPLSMADLGNIHAGNSPADTDFALKTVLGALLRKNITPVIIGGGHDLTYAQYLAYESVEQTVNLTAIDPQFDLGASGEELNSRSWLSHIILHQPNFLFNFSNIGYQTYFVEQSAIDLMGRLNFDVHRLGTSRSKLEELEPIIRNSDLISFDIGAIRQSEAPGNENATPNGFFGDEACQLARYAGISDKCSSFGIYELNPAFDRKHLTGHLVAQMIWCFVDGYYNRKKDFPFGNKADYTRYRVFLKGQKHEIIFYKSTRSDRWWMEVPYPPNQKLRFERHALVPCTYKDYEEACTDEMPDRWWQTFQKLS